jgi:hypothetical protein
MQMVQGEGPTTMKYYHLETFTTQDGCKRELKKARVLITTASETMDCIMVDRRGE